MKLFIGIVLILLGCVVLYSTYKTPKVEFSEGDFEPKFKGYGSGIASFIIGIAFIVDWFSD